MDVTENSYFTIRFGLWEKERGHFIPLREEAVEGIPDAEMHWVKFRMWTYGEELKWKSEFLEYNNATKSQFLNMEKLNERKIKFLMKDWSFTLTTRYITATGGGVICPGRVISVQANGEEVLGGYVAAVEHVISVPSKSATTRIICTHPRFGGLPSAITSSSNALYV